MIPPPRVRSPRTGAFPKLHTRRCCSHRRLTVSVNAIFGGFSAGTGGNESAVLDLLNEAKRFGGPSEAGNQAVAEAVRVYSNWFEFYFYFPKSTLNKNPRSKEIFGKWDIVYASGNTGLTALEGRISSFIISEDGTYENECTARVAGIFPGSAKEGGQLKVTGGNKFDLIQEYKEFNTIGGTSYEEVEQAPVRGFDVLAITQSALVMKLSSTTYFDEEQGRTVTAKPEGDYFLVWKKSGAAVAAPVEAETVEDEEETPTIKQGFLGGLFGGETQQVDSLATVAERRAGSFPKETPVEDSREAKRAAQQAEAAARRAAQQEEAAARRAAQQEEAAARRAEAEARKEQARAEAQARKEERAKQKQAAAGGTAIIDKPLFSFGGLGGKKDEPVEEKPKSAKPGLFGQPKAPAGKSDSDARREAAEQRRLEAQAKKEEEARKRQEELEMRRKINEVLSEMQTNVKESGATLREINAKLRVAERSAATAIRTGEAAENQLGAAEESCLAAEAELNAANESFNEIAGRLREKQREINAANAEAKKLEDNLVRL